MRRTVKVMGLSALVGALAFGGAAIARGPGPGGHDGPAPLQKMIQKLDLDTEQEALARSIQKDSQAMHEELAAQKSELFDVVVVEVAKEEPNARVIHSAIDDGLELFGDALHDRADAMLELQSTLSAEQRNTLVDEMTSMKERREDRMDQRRERFEDEE